jgi:capsular polysaccharide export protein
MKVIFLGLAKHQVSYFNAILQGAGLQGKVVTPSQLPFPSIKVLRRALRVVEWERLVSEKCAERAIKGRYHGALYRGLLRFELLVVALRFGRLIQIEQPDVVAVWNGGHRYCSLLTNMCHPAVLRLYFENGLLPSTTTIDPSGVNYKNSVPRDPGFYRGYADRYVNRLQRERCLTLIPRVATKLEEAVALPEHYIFIPFQDDWDTQIRLFSPWICNMQELFLFAELVAQRSGKTVVLKEHPSSRVKYPELNKRTSSKIRFANGNSTQELIEKAECVITINSTVGLEAILLNKPVLVLGEAFYAIDGIAVRAGSVAEALSWLEKVPNWGLSEVLRKAFISYLLDEYCVPGKWQEGGAEHYTAVARKIQALKHEYT